MRGGLCGHELLDRPPKSDLHAKAMAMLRELSEQD
jgi:hypothetical protein